MPEWPFAAIPPWPICELSELTSKIGSGATPRGGKEAYVDRGTAFIRSQNVLDNKLAVGDVARITEQAAYDLRNVEVREGDVLLNITGDSIARCCLAQARVLPARVSQHVAIIRPTKALNPLYLQKFLIQDDFKSFMLSLSSGGTRNALTKAQIGRFSIPVPPRRVQDAIASALRALDDKITVNDQIATAADELIRAHYANRCIDTCKTISINELGTLIRDSVPAESLTGDENYIALEHMPRRHMWLSNWESSARVVSAKMRFTRGDILFGKLRPYFHKVGCAFVDGVSSTDIFVIRPMQDVHRGWLLAALSSDGVVAHASAVGDGTRMPRVKWRDLGTYQVPWIGVEDATQFAEFVSSLSDRVASACAESRTLAELRDTLLPKLMSGEIRVRDAERIVEEAT